MTQREKEIEQAMKESVAETIYATGYGMTPQATDLLECAFTKGANWAIQATIDWLEWLQRSGSARGGLIVEEMIEDYKRKML